MATTHLIPVTEYLSTTYHPDCDYVDGEVLERNMGELDHATIQSKLLFLFMQASEAWGVSAVVELRVQVRPERFRIPDVCIISDRAPVEQIVKHAPVLCIEVLSPSDSMHRVLDRVDDFLAMGVPQVWIFDTAGRHAIVCTSQGMTKHVEGELALPGTPIRLSLSDVFSVLDRRPA